METNQGQVILVKDINPNFNYNFPQGSYPRNFIEFNDRLYFSASDGFTGGELWVTDGSTTGTEIVKDFFTDDSYFNGSSPSNFIEFNDRLYFAATIEGAGRELTVSDGTTAGTQLLKDIRPGVSNLSSYSYEYGSFPSNFIEFQEKLYFTANNGENGDELWVSDGTAKGTQLLVDINTVENNYGFGGSDPSSLIEFQEKLYFTANDGENGDELWVSDGTAKGTQLLVDIYPGDNSYGYANSSNPGELVRLGDKLYFSANDGINGSELWVTDVTVEGTQLVKDIRPETGNYSYNGSYIFYGSFTELNGKLLFTADDGVNGNELWVTDGTEDGTQLVKDIRPGTSNYGYNYGASAYGFTEFNGKLYFSANDGVNGNELWVTDGTSDGTQLIKDINPGNNNYGFALSSYPGSFTEFDGKLYFSANDGVSGNELWVTDGTADGTQLVEDIYPGSGSYDYPYSSSPTDLNTFNGELFFVANNGDTGRELYKLTKNDLNNNKDLPIIEGTEGNDNLSGKRESEKIFGRGGNDNLKGAVGDDSLLGGSGNDTLAGGAGNDTLRGNEGNDFLGGAAGDDSLTGDEGHDSLDGGAGADTLKGGNGDDNLGGNSGDDQLFGGAGNDTFDGGAGNDFLEDDAGDDLLIGGSGNDSIIGGIDNDTLDGRAGRDTLLGGSHSDVFVLRAGRNEDIIIDFELGSDRLGLSDGLEFADLSFSGQSISTSDEVLATLEGVNTDHLTADDFTVI